MLKQLDTPPSSGQTRVVTWIGALAMVSAVAFLGWFLNRSLNTIENAVVTIRTIVEEREAALAAEIVELQQQLQEERKKGKPDNRGDLDDPPGPVGGPGSGAGGGSPAPGTERDPAPSPSPKPDQEEPPPGQEGGEEPGPGEPTQEPSPEPSLICVDNPLDGVICTPTMPLAAATVAGAAVMVAFIRNGRRKG